MPAEVQQKLSEELLENQKKIEQYNEIQRKEGLLPRKFLFNINLEKLEWKRSQTII